MLEVVVKLFTGRKSTMGFILGGKTYIIQTIYRYNLKHPIYLLYLKKCCITEEMIVMPGEKESNGDVTMGDHPLSINPDSQWSTFFKDNEVLLQIDKDVRRLCPDISFFQQPTEFPCIEVVSSNDVKRLHTRVQRRVLKCANVERKGLGITKVFK